MIKWETQEKTHGATNYFLFNSSFSPDSMLFAQELSILDMRGLSKLNCIESTLDQSGSQLMMVQGLSCQTTKPCTIHLFIWRLTPDKLSLPKLKLEVILELEVLLLLVDAYSSKELNHKEQETELSNRWLINSSLPRKGMKLL